MNNFNEKFNDGLNLLVAIKKLTNLNFSFTSQKRLELATEVFNYSKEKNIDAAAEVMEFLKNNENSSIDDALKSIFLKNDNSTDKNKKVENEKKEISETKKEEFSSSGLGIIEKNILNLVKSEIQNETKNILKELENIKEKTTNEKTIKVISNNGEHKINGITHEKFETVLKLVNKGCSPYLTGEAGTGKSVICKQVADALGLEFYFSNAIQEKVTLTGFKDANGNYHETEFYKAFKNGGLFFLDEMDASIPDALIILNGALANGWFDFPNGKIYANKNFRVISAGNTYGLGADEQYTGRYPLDLSTLDRFIPVEIHYSKSIENELARGDTELVNFIEEFRQRIKDTGTNLIVSYRCINNIKKLEGDFELSEILKMTLLKNLEIDDIKNIINGMSETKYLKAIKELIK